MDVELKDIDELNSEIQVRIEPEDYREEFEEKLKEYRKQANIPGFREGKVPKSIIRKKYGKALLSEIVQQKIQKGLQEKLEEVERRPLGGPLPKEDQELQNLDPENPESFEFSYQIGFAPEIDTDLSKESFTYHKVKVDDEMLDQQVQDLCKRYGQLVDVEEAGEDDMITGEFVELDESGNEKEDGIRHRSSVVVSAVEDEEAKKQLIGAKKGDRLVVDPQRLSKGEQDLASMLNIEKEKARELDTQFAYNVEDIRRMKPAELDQELFDKVYGEGEVNSEEEFREKLRGQLQEKFDPESDKLLQKQVLEHLMEKQDLPLPDEHLKRWIKANNKEPITDEQLEADYDNYARNLKWQLIEGKIMRDNELKVEEQDAVDYTKSLLRSQYEQYGIAPPSEEEVEQSARKILSDQDQGERIFDNLYGYKLIQYLKENLELKEKEVPYDEFLQLAQGEEGKKKEEAEKSKEEETTN